MPPKDKNCRVLVVGFQAYSGDKPRYNYVASLNGIDAFRLYIQDDFVPNGDYYLGRNKTFSIEEGVRALINTAVEIYDIDKLIFIGSSKGGYAAVNFGIEYPNSDMVVAAPQYLLGNYMRDTKKFNPGLEDILGQGYTDEDVEDLNQRLREKLKGDTFGPTQRIYLHYSPKDDTYSKHLVYLCRDAQNAGISLFTDVGDYEGHNALRYFFPEYLRSTIEQIILEYNTAAP